MRYTYLLLNFFTILIPFCFSFEPKVHFYRLWRYYLPAMFLTALIFLIWDYYKTLYGVWAFNDSYIIGLRFFGLPWEEVLFFITVPYACTFTYEALTYYVRRRVFPAGLRHILSGCSVFALAASFFCFHLAYTFSVLLGIGIVLPIALMALRDNKLDKFMLMYVVSLAPMLVVNGFLTALPVVIYDDHQNLMIRVGTIPIEDFLYSAILLVMNVGIYEWIRQRAGSGSIGPPVQEEVNA